MSYKQSTRARLPKPYVEAYTDRLLGTFNITAILADAGAGRIKRATLPLHPTNVLTMLAGQYVDEGRVAELRAQVAPFEPYVVVRLNNGAFRMFDGRHRLKVQSERGQFALDCWVIDGEAQLERYRIRLSDGSGRYLTEAELITRSKHTYVP